MNIIVLTRLNDNMKMSELVPVVYAFNLKKTYGANITVISMSVECSQKTLDDIKDYGINNVIFVSDEMFRGSDTYATALILSESIKKCGIVYDLILSSDMSSFGETGFVPIMTAKLLGLDYEANVNKISSFDNKNLLEIVKNLSFGNITETVKMPCLIAVEAFRPESFFKENTPNLFDIMQFDENISVSNMDSKYLEIDSDKCGLKGSTTKVISSSSLNTLLSEKRKEEITDVQKAVDFLNKCLEC